MVARSKTRKPRNFVSDFFSSDFSILTYYPKLKTRKKKTREKNSELSELFKEVSKFSICHFLEFLIKYPRFKFQFSQIECVSRVLLFSFLTLFEFHIAGYWALIIELANILKVTNIIKEQCVLYSKLINVKKKNLTSNRSSRLEVLKLY